MPRLSKRQSSHVAQRWKAWVNVALTGHQLKKTKLARILGVPESRVRQWATGSRPVLPETAFDFGERLLDRGFDSQSGPVALYACGYLAEFFRLLRALSFELENGPKYAVQLFCSIPRVLMAFDGKTAVMIMKEDAANAHRDFYGVEVEQFLLDWHLNDKFDKRTVHRSEQILLALGKGEARDMIARAHKILMAGAPLKLRHSKGGDAIETILERAVSSMFALDHRAILDLAIEMAVRLGDAPFLAVAPRLWRMLCEWAYRIDSETFDSCYELLPWCFREYRWRSLTEDEADFLRSVEGYMIS